MVNFWLFYMFFGFLYVVSVGGSHLHWRKERSVGGDWGYSANNGPSTWKGMCHTGKNQSPINIQLGTAILRDFPPFSFSESYLTEQKFYVKFNGHSVYVALEDDSVQPTISGGGLEGEFIFNQLHFHWESEHEFEGKRADLEMHVVHYNSKYEGFDEAVTKADGLVVLAVIFDEKNETDHMRGNFIDNILVKLESVEHHLATPPSNNLLPGLFSEGDEDTKSASFALRDLLPKYVSRFFRYEGSLTTPTCEEVVQWTVFINRLPVSSRALKTFRTFQDHEGNTLLANYRPPQKLNGRKVFVQIKNYENDPEYHCDSLKGSASSSKSPINIYHCLFYSLLIFNKIKTL